ncbi:MAG: hypothetical protein ACLU38_10615 [Dysosmobacter sp.]
MAFQIRRSSSAPTALLPDWILWRAAPATTFTRTVLLPRQQTLKRYDVATYASATNSIVVSDARVSVYYRGLQKPSPSLAPPPLRCWAARN